MMNDGGRNGFMKKVFHFFIYIGFFLRRSAAEGRMTGKNAFPGEELRGVLPGGGISRGPGGGPGRRPPVSPVMPGPAWRPGGDVDAGSPPSGRVLSIAAESWGPVQAAAARRSYFQIFQTFQILFDFGQPGVGFGDQPRVPGYLPWPVSLTEGFRV